ncbi:MAG TPA: amidohydrolase, partial [Bryobacteraceae bacterium]|nr:amidohydrolase [Bryobacteraceae bacterium]
MHKLAAVLLASVAAGSDADLILHNGRVLTVDRSFSVREAVAVKNGRITAVGTSAAVLRERGTGTRVIDLEGRTVLPGLIDSHVHPLGAGLSEHRRRLPRLDSFAAAQSYVREQARITPKGQWIVVPRSFPTRLGEMRMPTREVLDVTRDHPVMWDLSYVVVANTHALELSGITRDTPNPAGGEIVRDASGQPNGVLKNAQGLLKGLRDSDPVSETDKLDALEGMLKRYVAAGLTSVIDRALAPSEIALYEKLRRERGLPLRVMMTWRMPTSGAIDEVVRRLESGPKPYGDEWLRLGIFKVTLDGGMTIGTAYQRAPYGPFGAQLYGKTRPDDRGQLFVSPDKLQAIMRAALARGYSLTAHSQGGGAIDALLDAWELLKQPERLAASRSHVMHGSFQSPESIARARRLGVLEDVQAAWLYLDAPALEKVFGDEGMKYFFPLKSFVDAGVLFAGGSDHMTGHDKNSATNPYNPFMGMWTSVTRMTTAGRVIHPEQRIGREDALRSYTLWAAYPQGAEKDKGSIEAGKFA